jgi:hypothetical protein
MEHARPCSRYQREGVILVAFSSQKEGFKHDSYAAKLVRKEIIRIEK